MKQSKQIKVPLEIERKWHVTDIDAFNAFTRDYPYNKYEIMQGYVCHVSQVRYRKQRLVGVRSGEHEYATSEKWEHYQAIKLGSGIARPEYEIKLTKKQFEIMWPATDRARLVKFRKKIDWKGVTLELDHLIHNFQAQHNNNSINGIYFLEIVFANKEAALKYVVPDFFGKEVTDIFMFSNFYLAFYGKTFQ